MVKATCKTLTLITVSVACLLPAMSLSMTRESLPAGLRLNKKSTALDVLQTLNKAQRLAPFLTSRVLDSNPVAVVTGGSSGIGLSSVETLALAGISVVLCARNITAAEEIVSSLPNHLQSKIRVQELDLADMYSIQRAASDIIETEGNIQVLLNNAGVMAPPKKEVTAQNLELQFGTNHVGHHMLTRLLLPHVSKGGRIVTVASTAHSFGQLDFENLNYDEDMTGKKERSERRYSPWGAYGQSKLANILFAKGLDYELKKAGSDIVSVSLHPGVIGTNLWRYTPKWTRPLLDMVATDKTIEQGAATSVFCCLVKAEGELNGGEYVQDCEVVEPSNSFGKDASGSLSKKLWKSTEELIQRSEFQLSEMLLEKN